MKMNKRGISPLIATVLIIGFTVALAAVIMTWGQSFSKSMSESTEETTNVQLTCTRDVVFVLDTVCSDTGKLRLTVENNGNKNLDEITARIKVDATTVDVVTNLTLYPRNPAGTVTAGLKAYDLGIYEIPDALLVDTSAADVTEVELIAVITVGGKEVTCPNAVAKFGDVVKAEKVASC